MALAALAVLASGCASPFAEESATLVAEDGAKLRENVAVKFTLRNEKDDGDLRVHYAQFVLRSGTGFFTCTNRAWTWRLLDVDPARNVSDDIRLAPGGTLEGYVEVVLCPDVAGPYQLTWTGDAKGEAGQSELAIRSLDARREADEPGITAIKLLARERGDESDLVPKG